MAATKTGNWEFVGKTTKTGRKSKQNVAPGKSQTKSFAETMPRIEPNAPVEESSTIYDAFLAKERKAEKAAQLSSAQDGAKKQVNGTAKKAGQPKKKAIKKPQGPSLEEEIKAIDVDELKKLLAQTQITFPDNHSVWLKDIASCISLKLDSIQELDPVYADFPSDYPSCLLSNGVRKMLNATLRGCSEDTLELFFDHCIQSMVKDISKGISTHGCRLLIQLMAHLRPSLTTSHLPKYIDLLLGLQSHALRSLSIMWALGQSAAVDVNAGLQVWLDLMLPVITQRSLTTYCVEYLEQLFSQHADLTSVKISHKDYFHVLDIVYSGKLQSPLQKRLLTIYPKFKELAFGSKPSSNLRNFFPSFLKRVSLGSKQQRDEMLSCLVVCLSSDKHCYSQWRQMYTNFLKESSILLRHLVLNWNQVSKGLDQKLLMATVRPFSITNEELFTQGTFDDKGGTQETIQDCKILIERLKNSGFPWLLLLMSVLTVVGGVVALDVYTSNGFKGSKTRMLLEDSGILALSTHVLSKVKVYTDILFNWCQVNIPIYWAKVCNVCGPYLQICWAYLEQFCSWLMVVLQPYMEWIKTNALLVMDIIKQKWPYVREVLTTYATVVLNFIWYYSLVVWNAVDHGLQVSSAWLRENIFVGQFSMENIHKTTVEILLKIQDYLAKMGVWITETLKNVMQK